MLVISAPALPGNYGPLVELVAHLGKTFNESSQKLFSLLDEDPVVYLKSPVLDLWGVLRKKLKLKIQNFSVNYLNL